MIPLLVVEDIHKRYGNDEVLRGVTFSMQVGETKVIIGPSGTGKSTLLRCINQLTVPDRGQVLLDGRDMSARNANVCKLRAEIGFVFQDFNLFAHLTALQNLALALIHVKRKSKKEAHERARKELAKVGLADKCGSYPAELSGGQQQRVAIARALAMDPRMILFDEPTSALDPELIGEVLEVMIDLAKSGMTILAVTHEMGFANSMADEILFMEGGTVLEQGPPDRVFGAPEHPRTAQFLSKISELYGGKE